MKLLWSTAVLLAVGTTAFAASSAAEQRPRLVSNSPARVGVPWTGILLTSTRPVVTARLGSTRQRIAARRLGPSRYRLRAVFRSPGRWLLRLGRHRLGSMVVRSAPLRLANAVDVVVEPGGSLLVADLSNRVFRLTATRLTLAAGNGTAGRSGDGGRAVRAAVGFPVEVAVDPRGGFGIVHGERWIRRVDAGIIRTVAEFEQPTALAYDGAGNLYVSELPGRVQRIAASGARTTFAGFNQPHGLDAAVDGTVYVCDTFNHRVQRIALDGTMKTLASGLNTPVDLDVGPEGNVYVADSGGSRILRITPGGRVTTAADGIAGTSSVAVAADGAIYVTERGRRTVRRIAVPR
jgi:hypothetical protein